MAGRGQAPPSNYYEDEAGQPLLLLFLRHRTFVYRLSKALFLSSNGGISRRLGRLTAFDRKDRPTAIQHIAKLLSTDLKEVRQSCQLALAQTDQLDHAIFKFFPHIDA